jgi:hypothetical protein
MLTIIINSHLPYKFCSIRLCFPSQSEIFRTVIVDLAAGIISIFIILRFSRHSHSKEKYVETSCHFRSVQRASEILPKFLIISFWLCYRNYLNQSISAIFYLLRSFSTLFDCTKLKATFLISSECLRHSYAYDFTILDTKYYLTL